MSGPSGTGHDTAKAAPAPHPRRLEDAALSLAHRAEYVAEHAEYVAEHIMDSGLAPRLQMLRDAVLDVRREVERARTARRSGLPPVAVPGPASVPPADTPAALRSYAEQLPTVLSVPNLRSKLLEAADEIDALLAVGERDKAERERQQKRAERAEQVLREQVAENRTLVVAGERDKAEIARLEQQIARLTEALAEITESRESFGDDKLYANHAERVAYNALNRPPAVLAGEEDAAT